MASAAYRKLAAMRQSGEINETEFRLAKKLLRAEQDKLAKKSRWRWSTGKMLSVVVCICAVATFGALAYAIFGQHMAAEAQRSVTNSAKVGPHPVTKTNPQPQEEVRFAYTQWPTYACPRSGDLSAIDLLRTQGSDPSWYIKDSCFALREHTPVLVLGQPFMEGPVKAQKIQIGVDTDAKLLYVPTNFGFFQFQ